MYIKINEQNTNKIMYICMKKIENTHKRLYVYITINIKNTHKIVYIFIKLHEQNTNKIR